MDRTVDAVPSQFDQLHRIQCLRDGSNVTYIYRLLASKRQDTSAISVANAVFDASNIYCFFSPEPSFFKRTKK